MISVILILLILWISIGIVVVMFFYENFTETIEKANESVGTENCEICLKFAAMLAFILWPIPALIVLFFLLRYCIIFYTKVLLNLKKNNKK
jgi:hypothetical protein